MGMKTEWCKHTLTQHHASQLTCDIYMYLCNAKLIQFGKKLRCTKYYLNNLRK